MQLVYDDQDSYWDLRWDGLLLRLALRDGRLLGHYFGPAGVDETPTMAGLEIFSDPLINTRSDAAIGLAPDERAVLWSLRYTTQPEPWIIDIYLKATDLPMEASLRFGVDEATGILRRQTTIRHTGNGDELEVSSAGSMGVLLPSDVTEAIYLTGRWGAESQVRRVTIDHSGLKLETRSGKTGFAFAPYVALLAPEHTYVSEILWSGNWEYHLRRLHNGPVILTTGLNSWGLRHRLAAGERLELPEVLLGCVKGDLNTATQRLHNYRRRMRPDADRPVPIQFNSWYPYQGAPPVERMQEFAASAAELGCEVFVLDAGWYTTEIENPAEGWWPRTGDWIVNKALFPNGLEELSNFCRAHGIEFGIWMEPEGVGASARIRREHPEWLHQVGGRPTPAHERAILHLGVPEARAYMLDLILSVLKSSGARWLKWDFNTDIYQGGWAPGLPDELTRQDPIIAHTHGLYLILDEIRAALPDLTLETCSSGGGRFDGAILSHSHANYISDQTKPLMKLAIHWGSQLAHPAVVCNDWLVEWPPHEGQHDDYAPGVEMRGDLPFRTRVAMLTSFGISAPVGQWSVAEFATVKTHVAWYKEIVRPLVQHGDQYLLTAAPPLDGNGDWAAVWYAMPDASRGVFFAFRLASHQAERSFTLPGLDPAANYLLRSPEGWTAQYSGAQLVAGLPVTVLEQYSSALLSVERLAGGT